MDPAAQDNQQTTTLPNDGLDDQVRHGDLPWTGATAQAPTVSTPGMASLPPLPKLPSLPTTQVPVPDVSVPNSFADTGLPGPLAEPESPPPPLPEVGGLQISTTTIPVALPSMPQDEAVTGLSSVSSGGGAGEVTMKKKGGKTGLVAGIAALVLLVGAATGGTLYISEQTRQQNADLQSRASLVPACRDGRDNDGDGKIDCLTGVADPGCFPDNNGGGGACNPEDENEVNQVATTPTQEELLACTGVVLYWKNNTTWTKGTAEQVATNTTTGEAIRLAVKPVDGTASVARFRVNDGDWRESTTKNEQGEFYVEYTPTTFETFNIEAQMGAYGYED